MHLPDLLGSALDSSTFTSAVRELSPTHEVSECKAYSDIVYLNYTSLGLSFAFSPVPGYKPKNRASLAELDTSKLCLTSIDIYNDRKPFSAFSHYPLILSVPAADAKPATTLEVTAKTMGREMVQAFGEPTRKGGGGGPKAGNVGVWLEWTGAGVMVEFASVAAPDVWANGAKQPWAVLTLFEPGSATEGRGG